ncbi:unnamed protein product [Symbiodinium pilosum]|uniref:Thioredoxin domain-containing protein n=1 Tax=Symbiodinium pilosum TaxID=2952 RepID=A0A812MCS3_SYMPI|nr:unnamed protein product [Symbiodinium pilosum]
MARPRRLTALAIAVAVGALLSLNAANTVSSAFAQTASLPATVLNYFTSLILVLTPGVAVSGGAYALLKRRESPPKPMWVISAALLTMLALAAPLVLPSARDAQDTIQEVELRSGEERLMPNGQFQLVSDPRPGNGPAEDGWQQALWVEMAEAIQSGEAQVVMVFSRPGCPWCEKLHPVLLNAIKRRAEAIASAPPDAVAEGPKLLHSPLRVFIYDATEFGPVMRRFGVEGFPTMYFFGQPGARPTVVPGYLSDEDFDKVAQAAAEAPVEPPPDERQRKRRGFFR